MKQSTSILWAACLGYGLVILDTSVLNVALPSIASEIGADGIAQLWIVDAYVLVMTALLLAGGGLIDRYGAKRVFNAGVALFALASLAGALAASPEFLIGARAVQGIGGALLIPATLTVVVMYFTDPQARGKAIAVIATVTASPQAFGPTLGGFLVDTLGWRSIFLLNIPIALIVLIFARKFPSAVPHPRRLDFAGVTLVAVALGGLTYAAIDFSASWQPSARTGAALAIAAAAFVLFWLLESRVAHPLLPQDVRRAPAVHLFVLAGTFMFILFYGTLFAANLYFQKVLGLSALTSGLLLLLAGVPVFVLPLAVSKVAKRTSPYALTVIGVTVATAGGALTYFVGTFRSPAVIAVSLLIVGVGFGIASPPHLNLATSVAPAGTTGTISALANAGRQAGYLLGVAAVGTAGVSVFGYAQATTVAVLGGVVSIVLLALARVHNRRGAMPDSMPSTPQASRKEP